MIRLGIDASNIRAGGGLTHLSQLLAAANPHAAGIDSVVVWGGTGTLAHLPQRDWLKVRKPEALDRALPWRMGWRNFVLSPALREEGCHVLFSPGGVTPPRCPVPSIVMSQNLLPFERAEYKRFPFGTWERFRLDALRRSQSASMRKAAALIFLSKYAQDQVLQHLGRSSGQNHGRVCRIIAHGIEERFFIDPPRAGDSARETDAFRLLYVSTVYYYKHQWVVAEAVADLRRRGIPVEVDFVGGGHAPAIRQLERTIARLDPEQEFLRYRGHVPFADLPGIYRQADAFVFASSCETFGIILLEAMAASLPVASSSRGPIPEVVGNAAEFFDPEDATSIARALKVLAESPQRRSQLVTLGLERARQFSWERCAKETLHLIAETARYGAP